jgi:hypothetical protein
MPSQLGGIRLAESEHGNPRTRDNHPYDCQGPLTTIDYQLHAESAYFLTMHHEILDEVFYHELQNDLIEILWETKRDTAA